jgi:hypothetical protein
MALYDPHSRRVEDVTTMVSFRSIHYTPFVILFDYSMFHEGTHFSCQRYVLQWLKTHPFCFLVRKSSECPTSQKTVKRGRDENECLALGIVLVFTFG